MAELHSLLQNHKWAEIQEAITKDKSVSMRIDDSFEEDIWFDEARRRKAAMEDIDTAFISNNIIVADDAAKQDTHAHEQDENEEDTLQLRYWTQPNNNANLFNIDSNIRANTNIQQKRTLLHSLCRMTFPSNSALVVQLTHGDNDGLQNLMGAVKTADMLINSSHNCYMSESNEGIQIDKCTECACHIFQHYCPPVALPPVERPESEEANNEDSENEQDESQPNDREQASTDMISHTSVLTMTDANGNTPLHSLLGEGSIHVDLIQVFLSACRPLDDDTGTDDNACKPTAHNLLVAQNYHGCTPIHFLAGE